MPEQICFPEEQEGNISGVWSLQNRGSGNEVASALATLGACHPTALGKVEGIHHPLHTTAAMAKLVCSLPERGQNTMTL